MPGTGHSHRYKGSISNRNTKSAFQVLAPWNAKKNGEKNQVAVSTGGDNLNFKLMGAKMMSNYNDASNAWVLDCSLVVLGNKIVDGSAIIQGNVEIDGTLEVKGKVTDLSDVDICGNLRVWGKVTDLSDVDICGNLRVWGKVTDLSDVDICGNLNAFTGTFNGELTNTDQNAAGGIVTKYLHAEFAQITNLTTTYLTDVSDNILTLGNHEPVNHEEMRGILARYAPQTGSADKYAFFGFDPSGLEGPTHDQSGAFVFFIDASSASTGVANETQGIPGRGVFGAIDISGGARYGGAVNNITTQANSAMVLIGRTIIATDVGTSAKLDISGGLNVDGDICGNGMNFAINYANVDISGSTVDIIGSTVDISGGTTNIDATTALNIGPVGTTIAIGNSNATVDISGSRVDISGGTTTLDALTALNIGPVSQDITIGNGTFGTTVELLGNAVHIFGETATLDAQHTLKIGPVATTIAIGNSNATVDISGSTVDISGGTHVKLIDGSGANINIASGLIHLDVSSTILGQTLGQIKLTDGSGAYIDMSGGKIDISGDDVTITSTSGTSLNLLGPKINIGTADSTIDIKGNVKVDATVTFVIEDISATNIDVSGNTKIHGPLFDGTMVKGTLGQVLSSTGTGIEWVDGTTVGSHWNVDSDGIHNTSGENVGIGKDSSNNVALDVSGNMAINGTINTLTVGFGSGDISNNTVVGYQALQNNTDGFQNVAVGYQALLDNSGGSSNVATGYRALNQNTTGKYNVATGAVALYNNISGESNVATGYIALNQNTTGDCNVAVGYQALLDNSDGSNNVAIGYNTGSKQEHMSNTINIGYDASCNVSNTACIGNADISCVYFGSISGSAKLDCSGIITTGEIDMSCNKIKNVSGIYFCDGSSFTHGDSLDISGDGISFLTNGTEQMKILSTGQVGIGVSNPTATLEVGGDASANNVTASGAVTGGSLTDGTATMSSGVLSGATTVTASGAVTGGSLTDGTATMSSGVLSGATTVTASGAVTGGSLTDGTATMSSGVLSGATTVTASGVVTGGSLTDGTATMSSGILTLSSLEINDKTISTTSITAGDNIILDPSNGTTSLIGKVTVPDPTEASNPATKQYVDSLISGLTTIEFADLATTASVDLTTGGLIMIDGFTVLDGSRVLVKNQQLTPTLDATENGVYDASNGAWVRASDFTDGSNCAGYHIFVDGGIDNLHTGWVVHNDGTNPVIVGTDDIIFNKFSSAGDIKAGRGLEKQGETLNVMACPSNEFDYVFQGNVTLQNHSLTLNPTSGTINKTAIGGNSPRAGTFTNLTVGGALIDSVASPGVVDQVLTSTVTGIKWESRWTKDVNNIYYNPTDGGGNTIGSVCIAYGTPHPWDGTVLNVGGPALIDGKLRITANLPSNTPTTGSLVVTGGVGVSGDIQALGVYAGNLGASQATLGTTTVGSLTDGHATMNGGALSGVTTVTASGVVTGGTLTDGFATMSGGALLATSCNIASVYGTQVEGGSLTDGHALLYAGDLTGVKTAGINASTINTQLSIGNTSQDFSFMDIQSTAGQVPGIKLIRGSGDYGGFPFTDNHNSNFGMVVTDNGWELDALFTKGENINNRVVLLKIDSGGNGVLIGTWSAGSDDRIKHNEKDIKNAINVIKQLKPQTYFKNTNGKIYNRNHNYKLNDGKPITEDSYINETGLIAQDIQKIPELSHLVTGKEIDNDGLGNQVETPLSLNYNGIFVYSIGAIQELIKKNENLEHKIADLETKLTNLIDQLKANNTIN